MMLLLLISLIPAALSGYIGDIEKVGSKTIYLYSRNINIEVYNQNGSDKKNYKGEQYFYDKFIEFSILYKEKWGIGNSRGDCTANNLKIVYLKEGFLNNERNIAIWTGNRTILKEGETLLGLYTYKDFYNTIYISDSKYDIASMDKRFIHEISHFWYAKSCLNSANEENERRAVEMEKNLE